MERDWLKKLEKVRDSSRLDEARREGWATGPELAKALGVTRISEWRVTLAGKYESKMVRGDLGTGVRLYRVFRPLTYGKKKGSVK